MKFHREGRASLLFAIAFSAIIVFIAHYFYPESKLAHWMAYIMAGAVIIIVAQFFRHPTRAVTTGETYVVAPADGKVDSTVTGCTRLS